MTPPRAATHDALLTWRDEFPSLERQLHFVSHSLGAMPRGVGPALEAYARTWRERGIRAWEEDWFDLPTRVGDVIAGLLGGAPGSVSMHENVTVAQAVALSAIAFAPPRDTLVCTAEDFPSVLYLYEGLIRRGARVVRVAGRGHHRVEAADVIAEIDSRTAVVAISHVLFRSSQVLDVAAIAHRARDVGAWVLLDAYQSVGTVPVDAPAMGIDLLVGGSVKWLCGGPGGGYLYAGPRARATLEPALTGWMAHERPFDFDSGPTRRDPGARHFWTGTPGIPSYVAALPGYEIVRAVGVAAIREKSLRQTERMLAWADEFGLTVTSPRDTTRGGTVVLDVPHPEAVCRGLLAQDVLLDQRPGVGLRLAPHFYTRDEEVDEVMRRVRDEVAKAR